MRSFIIALAFAPAAALAQAVPAPPPPDDNTCAGFTALPNNTGERAPGAGADAAQEPGFGFLQVVSPPPNLVDAPRNVEIRLSGEVTGLDVDPPVFSVELRDANAARLELVRVGANIHPAHALDAQQTYVIHIEPTAANPCPECSGIQEQAFTTGDDIDRFPPLLDGEPPVNVFVMPSPEEAARCNMFFSQTHQVVIDLGPAFPLNTWINMVGKPARGDTKSIAELFNSAITAIQSPLVTDLGPQLPVALGDEFLFAFTPRDLAGNVGRARIIRTRARSFVDENKPRDTLAPLWCSMPSGPEVTAAASVPSNGRIQVAFPFEEIPLALRNQDGAQTPLIPVDDSEGGHVYNTALPLAAGTYNVVALDCPHCVCDGCAVPPGATIGGDITVSDVVDTVAPDAPVVKEFREDSEPALSVAEPCHPDRPALVAVLAAGNDDHTAALDLRYDAVISVKGGPALQLGRSLIPFARADGTVALRIDTRGLGRVLGQPFALTLDAIDAAGNRTEATANSTPDTAEGGGCASTSSSASAVPLSALALGLAILGRRRRRR